MNRREGKERRTVSLGTKHKERVRVKKRVLGRGTKSPQTVHKTGLVFLLH